jgi:DNA repair ATPase RecN
MASHYTELFKTRLHELEKHYAQRQAAHDLLVEERDAEQDKIDKRAQTKLHLEKVVSTLIATADAARESGRQRMEKVVTKALQSVFGPSFTFEIELAESGGKPVANFYVVSENPNGEKIKNEPQDSRGGGVNDIVATALQVATMVVYNNPKIQGPILLDEPGKHVSEDYIVKFGEFVDFIGKTFDRQIIMVTHQPHLAQTADKTFISQLVSGKTVLREQDLQPDDGIVDDETEIEWES